jgi:hypothetical protein
MLTHGTTNLNKRRAMKYDPEKYREKREKVSGVKKRGISFFTLAIIISSVIITGLSLTIAPKLIFYIAGRHLDDAIFRVSQENMISQNLIAEIERLKGVQSVKQDMDSFRLVITFDRRETQGAELAAFFEKKNQSMILLNEHPHGHH